MKAVTCELLALYDNLPETIPLPGEGRGIKASLRRSESGAIARLQISLTNSSDGEICLRRAFLRVPLGHGPYEYYAQRNRWSLENRGSWAALNEQCVVLMHKEGRTTEGNSPFCALRRIGQDAGTAFHIIPQGNWRIRIVPLIDSNTEPEVAVDLGICDENLAFRLAPGATWELPEVLIHSFADFDGAMEGLHRYLLENQAPDSKRLPVLFNTWFDRFEQLDVPHLRRELAAAAEIGCEAFVIDAGWFGRNPGWWEVGDYREQLDRAFFGNMRAFAEEVRALGLDFGIWMEPERYFPGVPIRQEHPEWFIPSDESGCCRLDLTLPAAYDYLRDEMVRLIETYGLGYIKTDMNAKLGPDDSGAELHTYQRAFFRLIDELKARYPRLVIENCSSGAMRSDLATLRHFDVMFPSDNVNPWSMLPCLHGLWRRMLPGRIARWISFRELKEAIPNFSGKPAVITPAEATWEEFESCDLESLLIANFTGGLYGFSGDVASLSADNRLLVRKYVDLFKSKRDFMLRAAGHWLEDSPRIQALELEHGGNAIIEVFHIASDAIGEYTVFPVNLVPEAQYRVYDRIQCGRDIMTHGVTLKLEAFQHWKWRARMLVLDKQ